MVSRDALPGQKELKVWNSKKKTCVLQSLPKVAIHCHDTQHQRQHEASPIVSISRWPLVLVAASIYAFTNSLSTVSQCQVPPPDGLCALDSVLTYNYIERAKAPVHSFLLFVSSLSSMVSPNKTMQCHVGYDSSCLAGHCCVSGSVEGETARKHPTLPGVKKP